MVAAVPLRNRFVALPVACALAGLCCRARDTSAVPVSKVEVAAEKSVPKWNGWYWVQTNHGHITDYHTEAKTQPTKPNRPQSDLI